MCFEGVLLPLPCFRYVVHFCVAGYVLGYMEGGFGLHNV